MKISALVILIACACVAFAQASNPTGAWMPIDVKWQSAPADVEPNLSIVSTRVLYFQPDGKMNVIGCVVNRQFSHYTISAGDGQTIAAGDWHEENGRILARSRLVYRSVQIIGEALPGPWINDVLMPKDGKLLLKGVIYGRVPDLDKGAAELMPKPDPSNP
jgi:hypothetical protein